LTLAQTIQVDFGKAIRQMREEAGISQETLALRAGLGRSYFSGVERGVRNIGLVNIAKVADVLDVSPGAIFERAESIRAA
jgi:transcriptional regulator with XRE-family HTH domain